MGPKIGEINKAWGEAEKNKSKMVSHYTAVSNLLQEMDKVAQKTWETSIYKQTNKNYHDGFANELYEKYGLDIKNPYSLMGMDGIERSKFFMDFYDGLMEFSGMDHIDH